MAERRPLVLKNGRRVEMPAGDTIPVDVLPSGSGGLARWTPTLIAADTIFTVSEFTQMLTIAPVVLDGTLVLDGYIVIAEPETTCPDEDA